MKIGDFVEKISGYKWPGVVVAVFWTRKCEQRVVVECTVPEVAGALHIYSPEQLRVVAPSPALLRGSACVAPSEAVGLTMVARLYLLIKGSQRQAKRMGP